MVEPQRPPIPQTTHGRLRNRLRVIETTGVLGIKSRGTVFTVGGSLVREITSGLDLGAELVGAITRNFDLGKSQLQAMVGGNYSLTDKMTFDFGIVTARHAASPRVGVQPGISIDW